MIIRKATVPVNLTVEAKKIGAIGLSIGILGTISSIEGIAADLGAVGIAISIVLTIAVFAVCFLVLRPLLLKNARGVTMLEAITTAGLVDIESREDEQHTLPPVQFYRQARREVVISGISMALTFQLHVAEIRDMLNAGIKVYVLMVHPGSLELNIHESRTQRRINDIRRVISAIQEEELIRHPGFHVRFRRRMPSFAAIMIDGDLVPTGTSAQDATAHIRVEPAAQYLPLQRGVVIHLKNGVGERARPFNYFAEDLRSQWHKDGRECPELFAP